MGLRERKKEQTRQRIAETAWRLFADRGFDQVTVAEVARQAEVATATVFNYFPTKEDLFYARLETFEARLVEAIGTRPVGEPVLATFRRHLLESGGLLAQVEAGDPEALERVRTLHRVIAASPALRAREQQVLAAAADALAAIVTADIGVAPGDPGAQVAANALVGVQRVLIDYTRRRVLADEAPGRLAADVRQLGRRVFALLEHGLADYAPKPDATRPAPGLGGSERSGAYGVW
jgi:AcrR family transcriptional regulator